MTFMNFIVYFKYEHQQNLLWQNCEIEIFLYKKRKNLFKDISSSKAGKEQLCNDYNFQAW